MTSWEIRVKLPEPPTFAQGSLGGAMRETKAVKLGSQRAGVEESHEG